MGKRKLECPVCSIDVERSWRFCPNCNYWFGDLEEENSNDEDPY
jgi:hypothetical protein